MNKTCDPQRMRLTSKRFCLVKEEAHRIVPLIIKLGNRDSAPLLFQQTAV